MGACDPGQISISNLHLAQPYLSPLIRAGGWTPVSVPAAYSDAIDHATCFDALTPALVVDQRGRPRPLGGGCDIGAVEYTGDYIFAGAFE